MSAPEAGLGLNQSVVDEPSNGGLPSRDSNPFAAAIVGARDGARDLKEADDDDDEDYYKTGKHCGELATREADIVMMMIDDQWNRFVYMGSMFAI